MKRFHLLPVLKTVQILVNSLAAAIGVVVLALSASVLRFTNKHSGDNVSVKYYYKGIAYDQDDPYLPSNFTRTRPILLIIAGVICMLVNIPLLVWQLRRPSGIYSEGRKTFLLVLAAIAFALLFTLATTIYSWSKILSGNHDNDWAWRPWTYGKGFIVWNPSIGFDPISWNCALYPYLYKGQGEFGDKGPGQATFKGICHQGMAAIDLLLLLPILEAVALSLHLWLRHMAKGSTSQQLKDAEPDAYRMDDLQGLVPRDGNNIET